jgi:predicted transcriptional regulator
MRSFELRAAFERVFKELSVIKALVSGMPQVHVQVSNRFLATLNALGRLNRPATAGEVAAITSCSRAHESMILNELVGRGIVTKEKQGRKHLFKAKFKVKVEDEG